MCWLVRRLDRWLHLVQIRCGPIMALASWQLPWRRRNCTLSIMALWTAPRSQCMTKSSHGCRVLWRINVGPISNRHQHVCIDNRTKRRSGLCVGLSRQRSMVQASVAALLFLTEVFRLCTCSPEGLFPEGQARIKTNIFINSFIYLFYMQSSTYILNQNLQGDDIYIFCSFPSCKLYSPPYTSHTYVIKCILENHDTRDLVCETLSFERCIDTGLLTCAMSG